jgi:hypothetical protein
LTARCHSRPTHLLDREIERDDVTLVDEQ